MGEDANRLIFHILLVFLILNLLLPGERHSTVLTLTQMVIFGLGAIYILFLRPPAPRRLPMAVLSAAALLLSQLVSLNAHNSLQTAVRFGSMLVLAWLVSEIRPEERDVRLFCSALVAAAAALSIYGLMQLFTFFAQPLDPELVKRVLPVGDRTIDIIYSQKRISSVFGLPTTFSAFLALALPVAVGLAVFYRRNHYALAGLLAAVGLMAVALVQAKSHGGPVALLAAGAVTWLVVSKKRSRLTLAGILGVLAAGILFIWAVGLSRGDFLWDFAAADNPVRLRADLWLAGLSTWTRYWLLGTGLGNFHVGFFPFVGPGVRESKYLHNTYLQLPIELGVLGLAVVLAFLVIVGRRLVREARSVKGETNSIRLGILAASLTYLFANGVEIILYLYSVALLGAFLLGLWLGRPPEPEPQPAHEPPAGKPAWKLLITGLFVIAFVLLGRWFLADYFFGRSKQILTETAISETALAEGTEGPAGRGETAAAFAARLKSWNEINDLAGLAAAIDGGNYEYFQLLGRSNRMLYDLVGDEKLLDRALERYRTALSLCPGLPDLHFDYALVLALKHHWLAANRELTAAARLYPASEDYKTVRKAAERRLRDMTTKTDSWGRR
jgi:hypothetical protein